MCFTMQYNVPIIARLANHGDSQLETVGPFQVCNIVSGKFAEIILQADTHVVDFKIPFEMSVLSLLTAVTSNQSVMDNERTKMLFEPVEDPETHPVGKIADETLVEKSDLSRSVRCFRIYWTCVSNLVSDFSYVCHKMRMRRCDI